MVSFVQATEMNVVAETPLVNVQLSTEAVKPKIEGKIMV